MGVSRPRPRSACAQGDPSPGGPIERRPGRYVARDRGVVRANGSYLGQSRDRDLGVPRFTALKRGIRQTGRALRRHDERICCRDQTLQSAAPGDRALDGAQHAILK
jgi:hypothetical protein